MDQLAEFALTHLARTETEHKEQRIDRVTLAATVGSDNRRERLVEGSNLLAAGVRLEVVQDELVDDESRLGRGCGRSSRSGEAGKRDGADGRLRR